MLESAAYVRCGFRAGNVDICTIQTPLPEDLFAFGERWESEGAPDFVRIKTRNGDFTPAWIALDWLRDRDWIICPNVNQFSEEDIGYVTASRIRERGWTPKMIEELLQVPDKEVKNPHYRTSAAMKLYAVTRVALLEQVPQVVELLQKKAKRKT